MSAKHRARRQRHRRRSPAEPTPTPTVAVEQPEQRDGLDELLRAAAEIHEAFPPRTKPEH